MTPEERFERIEANLERVSLRLDQMSDRVDILTERMDKFEVTLEVLNHTWNERFNKLWETQTIIMGAQNQSWQAIGTVVQTIGTLTQTVGNLTETVGNLTQNGGYDRQGITSTERQRIQKGRTPACTPPHL